MKRSPLFLLVFLLASCGAASPRPGEPREEAERDDEPPPTFAIALRLQDAGTDENETPRTRVMLVKIAPDGERTVAELHVETGACWHDAGSALITARCWWAGSGAAYEVRREGEAVIARRRATEEDSEAGPWEESGRVEVPEDAVLQILAPGRSSAPLPTGP